MEMPFEIVRNDITRMQVDAIVNAANGTLLGGGGVDGAIHRAAGPELLEECRSLGGCETGKAKITRGYRLPCRYVIHTVGPVWEGGEHGEEALLVSCYRESLRLAEEYGCESVAFPLISSGVYGYPKDRALKVATDTIRDFLLEHEMQVFLVVFDRDSFAISKRLYARIQAYIDDSAAGVDYERREQIRRRANILHGAGPARSARESVPLPRETLGYPKAKAKPEPETFGWDSMADAMPAAGPAAGPETAEGLSESLDRYLEEMDEGFRDMLLRKIDERHMTDAECYKRANIDRKLFNKIKNQEGYRPGKPTVLALAVALRLPPDEIREMLMKAGFALSRSSKFDMIVDYFIRNGNYDIYEINEALFAFDQKLLGSVN